MITSLHLIVTHEIYEMIKLLNLYTKAQKQPKRDNLSNSISGSLYSGSQYSSNNSGNRRSKENDPKLDSNQLARLKEEARLILQKPNRSRSDKKLIIKDPRDKVDLFGQSFDSKYLGSTKEEMHTYLQQRSFRGLYTRLQFWVNLLLKHLYEKKEEDPSKQEALNRNIRYKYCNVLSFIMFMRDTVLDIYENSTDTIPEFEWNKHVRMILEDGNKACVIECGG